MCVPLRVGLAAQPRKRLRHRRAEQSRGQFKLTGKPYNSAPYGIAVPKNSGLAEPVLAALKKVMASGEYAKILHKWGITQGAIKEPAINPVVQ